MIGAPFISMGYSGPERLISNMLLERPMTVLGGAHELHGIGQWLA